MLSIHINQFEKMLYDATTTIDDMHFLKTLLSYKKIDVINIEPDRSEIYNQQGEENLPIYDKEIIRDKIAIRLNELTALIEFIKEKEEKGKEEEEPFDEKKINDEINDLKKKYNLKNSSSSSNNNSNSNAMYISASTKLSDIVKMNTQ